jgi:hypothetical protein
MLGDFPDMKKLMELIEAAHVSGGDHASLEAAGEAMAKAGAQLADRASERAEGVDVGGGEGEVEVGGGGGCGGAGVGEGETQGEEGREVEEGREEGREVEEWMQEGSKVGVGGDGRVNMGVGLIPDPTRVHAGTAIQMLRYHAMRRPKGLYVHTYCVLIQPPMPCITSSPL